MRASSFWSISGHGHVAWYCCAWVEQIALGEECRFDASIIHSFASFLPISFSASLAVRFLWVTVIDVYFYGDCGDVM